MHDERMDSGGGVRRRRSGDGLDDDEPLLDWIIEDSVMIVVSIVGLTVGLTVFFFLDFAAFLLALDGPGIFKDDDGYNQTRTVTVTRQLNPTTTMDIDEVIADSEDEFDNHDTSGTRSLFSLLFSS